MSSFGETEQRKARKVHECDWCNEHILPGETYFHWYGLSEEGDYPAKFDTHVECEAAIDRERERLEYEWMSWGEFHNRGMTLEETEQAMLREDAS